MAPLTAAILFGAVTATLLAFALTKKEKVYYADLEHMNLTFWSRKHFKFLNTGTGRCSRQDPVHYLYIHLETLVAMGNNVSVAWYYYEYLSNEYRRSFVEFHAGLCELLFTNQYLSPFLKDHIPKGCPIAPGAYHLVNLSFVNLPVLKTFPFSKGRVYGNYSTRGARLVEFYVDAEIKQKWIH